MFAFSRNRCSDGSEFAVRFRPFYALNQIEIFFSILQRKVLTPAVADSLAELEARLLAFEADYRRHPRPVRWKFTRQEFDRRLRELEHSAMLLAA